MGGYCGPRGGGAEEADGWRDGRARGLMLGEGEEVRVDHLPDRLIADHVQQYACSITRAGQPTEGQGLPPFWPAQLTLGRFGEPQFRPQSA